MTDAYALLPEDWANLCKEAGWPAFRAKQILQGLYRDRIGAWPELTTLPGAIRDALAERVPLRLPSEVTRTPSTTVSLSPSMTCQMALPPDRRIARVFTT